MRKIRTDLLTPLDRDRTLFLKDHALAWEGSAITAVRPYDPALDADCEDWRDCLALPGFVDVHTHLSQYRIRGRYEPALLDWLEKYVFPAEALSRDPAYAELIAEEFFHALFAAGTTTAMIYTAPFQEACEAAFAKAEELGARAFIGMTLMDRNSPADLLQTTDYAFSCSVELYERHHGSSGLLDYIFTPRFALSCSEELMRRLGRFTHDRGAWLQTHLSENPQEIEQVRRLFERAPYTQVYADLGLLSPRSVFAHAIHLTEPEIALLASHECKVAHCPDSNFFLKSGELNYPALEKAKIPIGLGSDVAAGSTLNMLYHAKLANYRQSSYSLQPERLFYHITLGNAELLGLGDRVGSLEPGKEADLCLLQRPAETVPDEELLSALCFWGHELPVRETVIAGRTVYRG